MKLKPGFVTHNVGNEQMMVAAGPAARDFHGLVRSNETAAFIINCLKEETTEKDIVDAMLEQYEAPRETVEQDVHRVVAKLWEIGALQ